MSRPCRSGRVSILGRSCWHAGWTSATERRQGSWRHGWLEPGRSFWWRHSINWAPERSSRNGRTIEQEGTYPLPEAQLDRFMFLVRVDYPSLEEELKIVEMTTKPMTVELDEVLTGEDILEIQNIVRRVPISEHVVRYVLNLVRATRVDDPSAPELVRQRVAWGAGPRASQFMILGAKARALLHGRLYVSTEDVEAVALPVLRHRVLTTYGAEAEGYTSDRLIAELMESIPAAESETLRDERLPNVLGS